MSALRLREWGVGLAAGIVRLEHTVSSPPIVISTFYERDRATDHRWHCGL